MSAPLLRFEDGKIAIGGHDLVAQSANLSIAPTLEVERVYGDYDPAIVGARTDFVKFSPTQNLRGQLEVSFFISADRFAQGGTTNTIDRMFDIAAGMSEEPINDNVVGRYRFDNMYLKSFGFSMNPFQTISATASYDIYGSVEKQLARRFTKDKVDFAHSLKSFGQILASGIVFDYEAYVDLNQDLLDYYNSGGGWNYGSGIIQANLRSKQEFGESHWTSKGQYETNKIAPPEKVDYEDPFEVANLKYNIIVNRKIHNHIRSSENTAVNTRPEGVTPVRVTVESIEKEMTIESNEMLDRLNAYGNQQTLTTPFGLSDPKIEAFLLSLQGEKIARFSAQGKVQSQSLSVAEGQHAKSNITIKEIIK